MEAKYGGGKTSRVADEPSEADFAAAASRVASRLKKSKKAGKNAGV